MVLCLCLVMIDGYLNVRDSTTTTDCKVSRSSSHSSATRLQRSGPDGLPQVLIIRFLCFVLFPRPLLCHTTQSGDRSFVEHVGPCCRTPLDDLAHNVEESED